MRALLVLILILPLGALGEELPPAEVMLLGTFHFVDPGEDAVKVRSLNVLDPASQDYLEALTSRIAIEFAPTRVLLEFTPEYDELLNERYSGYLAGEFELRVNEIYQLGFRIARKSGLSRIEPWDHRGVPWLVEPMLEYAKEHDSQAVQAFEASIADITAIMQERHDTKSLRQLLQLSNAEADFQANKALYVLTNDVGNDQEYPGADAAASWWHRNFRMYANVQRLAGPGERVLVIGGSGHIAIIADLLALDESRTARPVLPLL